LLGEIESNMKKTWNAVFPENERKYGDSDFGKTDGMM